MNETTQLVLVGVALLWASSRVIAGIRQWTKGKASACSGCPGSGDCGVSCTTTCSTQVIAGSPDDQTPLGAPLEPRLEASCRQPSQEREESGIH